MAQILIVDDDETIRGLFRKILEGDGHVVSEASDGERGMQQFTEVWPDLVITDIVMPEKDGLELLIELRRKAPDVKLIAISGGGGLNPFTYLTLARERGANAVLFKPIPIELLLKTVQQVLRGTFFQDSTASRPDTI